MQERYKVMQRSPFAFRPKVIGAASVVPLPHVTHVGHALLLSTGGSDGEHDGGHWAQEGLQVQEVKVPKKM